MANGPLLSALIALLCLTPGIDNVPARQAPALVAADTVTIPLPSGFHPSVIAAADFTGDGHVDVALCGASGALLLLEGDGRGALGLAPQPGSDTLCGEHPDAIVSGDLDGDGRIDIIVANHATNYVTVLSNQGGGRFSAHRVAVRSTPHPHTVAAADVNGDGRMDLITDSWGDRRILWLAGNKDGGWSSPGVSIDVARAPYVNIIAADFNGDGHADLAFPNAAPSEPFNSVSLLFGDGHGDFQPAPQSPIIAGPAPFKTVAGDVNGDGRPDLLVTNYSGHITDASKDGLTWIRNDGAGRFTAFPDRIATGHGTWDVASGDLDGDGFADAAFINAADDTVGLAYGSRTGPTSGGVVNVMPEPHRVALADLRGNRHDALLVTTEQLDALLVVSVRDRARLKHDR
jgi:hypothetical protein